MHRLILILLFTGCSTVVYNPNGTPRLRTYADARNINLSKEGDFHADELIHSKPTAAGGDAAAKVITAGGAAAVTRGLVPIR